jgi:Raffinose synthase or seed imbibition protein Sip1
MAEYHAAARAVGGCAIYVRYILYEMILFNIKNQIFKKGG